MESIDENQTVLYFSVFVCLFRIPIVFKEKKKRKQQKNLIQTRIH